MSSDEKRVRTWVHVLASIIKCMGKNYKFPTINFHFKNVAAYLRRTKEENIVIFMDAESICTNKDEFHEKKTLWHNKFVLVISIIRS